MLAKAPYAFGGNAYGGVKKLLGVAASATLIVAPALAADVPVKAPAPAAIVAYNWTGLYVGANVGWVGENFDWTYTNPVPNTPPTNTAAEEHARYQGTDRYNVVERLVEHVTNKGVPARWKSGATEKSRSSTTVNAPCAHRS